MAIDQALIANLLDAGKDSVAMQADVIDCQICPVGSDCSQLGATLEALPLIPGYFRLDATTNDVRECPDARKNCSTSFGTSECISASGCQGGASGDGCAPGLSGTYCELCDRSNGSLVFYSKASSDGVATCEKCGDTLSSMLLTGVLGLVGLVVLVLVLLLIKRFVPPKVSDGLKTFNENFTPRNKIKIILGAYQISTKIPIVYSVTLPNDVNKLLNDISSLVTFGIQGLGVDSTPLECLGLSGYFYKLITYMLLPPIVIVIVILKVCISTRRAKAKKRRNAGVIMTTEKSSNDDSHGGAFHVQDSAEPEREETLFEKTLPAVLSALFVIYPMVTKVAFDGFPCYSFEDGTRGWLIQDVSIECGTPDQTAVTMFAWIAVILCTRSTRSNNSLSPPRLRQTTVRSLVTTDPIGIWVFCALLLVKASTAILAGKETPLSRAIGFLYKEYDVTAFWWELMEMLRKFLLCGLFVVLKPGSIEQIAIGTIFSATCMPRTDSDPRLDTPRL